MTRTKIKVDATIAQIKYDKDHLDPRFLDAKVALDNLDDFIRKSPEDWANIYTKCADLYNNTPRNRRGAGRRHASRQDRSSLREARGRLQEAPQSSKTRVSSRVK